MRKIKKWCVKELLDSNSFKGKAILRRSSILRFYRRKCVTSGAMRDGKPIILTFVALVLSSFTGLTKRQVQSTIEPPVVW